MEEKKKFPVIYLLAILYALSAYLGPVAFLIMSDADAAGKVLVTGYFRNRKFNCGSGSKE